MADPERRFWGRRPPLDGVELMSGREYSAAAKKADCRAGTRQRGTKGGDGKVFFSLKKMEKRFGTPLEGVESAARRFDISTLFY